MKFKDFFNVGEVFGYFFKKKDPNQPRNFNTRAMHTINRIAIIIFLLAIIFFTCKKLFLK